MHVFLNHPTYAWLFIINLFSIVDVIGAGG
jgi:hypothetical protein